jgi:hypothetical protein
LEQLGKNKDSIISIETKYGRKEFMYLPMIKAMLDLNIVFKSKYYDTFHVEHFLYGDVILDYVSEKKQAMNEYELMKYRLYRMTHGIKFGSKYSGVP